MKLYRFTASNTQRAIMIVTEKLGPNALVYSTRKIPGGIEVLAGLPFGADSIVDHGQLAGHVQPDNVDDEIKVQEAVPDNKVLENIKLQVETMNDSIQMLSDSILMLQQTFSEKPKRKKFLHWNFLKKIDIAKLLKIGSRGRQSTNLR